MNTEELSMLVDNLRDGYETLKAMIEHRQSNTRYLSKTDPHEVQILREINRGLTILNQSAVNLPAEQPKVIINVSRAPRPS